LRLAIASGHSLGSTPDASRLTVSVVGCVSRTLEIDPNYHQERINLEGAKRLLKQRRP